MIEAIALVPGSATGIPYLLSTPLSFWGGYDSTSGQVIDRHHPDHGAKLANRILMMESGRGSSSGSSVLAEAIRAGTAPAAILMLQRDAIVVTGAIVAAELYGRFCPIVLITSTDDWQTLHQAKTVVIDCTENKAVITF